MTPARDAGRGTVARGKPCKRGHDEWWSAPRGYRCAACGRVRSRTHARLRNDLRPFDKMWRAAKERAHLRDVPFLLTVAEVEAVWPEDGCCPALGMPLVRARGFPQADSPSLDRLSNEMGYEPGNIAIISHRANTAKGDMTARELEQVAAWMRRNGLD